MCIRDRTEALMEFETLEGSQVMDILEYGEMKNPPAKDVYKRQPMSSASRASYCLHRYQIARAFFWPTMRAR